jgi:hypothetical protein
MLDAVRAHDRIDVEGLIRAKLTLAGGEPPVEIVNISRTGAALMAEEPIGAVPAHAKLRMSTTDENEWVSCICELRYVLGENRPGGAPGWLHGVRFTEVPQPLEAFIDRLIATAAPA